MNNRSVSFIIPCYNSEESLEHLIDAVITISKDNNYEPDIILVNDGSVDNTWNVITKLCDKYEYVSGLNLSRNFGQQSARMAAVNFACGEYAVFMDDDGQHDPSYVPLLLEELEKGYDIVYGTFIDIKQPLWRKMGSAFRRLTAVILEGSPNGLHPTAFFAVRGFLIRALKEYPSPNPSVFGYLMKSTRNIGTVPLEQKKRENGRSGYSFRKLVSTWLNEMLGFSIIPLRVSSVIGCLSAVAGIITLFIVVYRKLSDASINAGYTSTVAIILLLGGIVLMMLGIIGEYIGRLFMTINKTPQYMIREIVYAETRCKKN